MRERHLTRRSFMERVAGTVVAGGALASVTGCAAGVASGVTDRDLGFGADPVGRGRGARSGVTDRDPSDPVGRGRGTQAGGTSFSGATGWNGAPVFFPSDDSGVGTAEAIDVNGDVGHPLTVSNPRANCAGGWTANAAVLTGSLPPGLSFGQYNAITGIPTARGHWIVTVALTSRTCNGSTFRDIHQQIRFHITGGGTVNQ